MGRRHVILFQARTHTRLPDNKILFRNRHQEKGSREKGRGEGLRANKDVTAYFTSIVTRKRALEGGKRVGKKGNLGS